jgi:hypothetical protein
MHLLDALIAGTGATPLMEGLHPEEEELMRTRHKVALSGTMQPRVLGSPTVMRCLVCVLLFSACVSIASSAVAQDDPLIVLFYSHDCESCEEMDEFLTLMTFGEPETVIARHEISDAGSVRLLSSLSRAYGIEVPSIVPVVFVADEVFIGYEGLGQETAMTKPIGDCLADPVQYGCESPIAKLPRTQIQRDLPRLALMLVVFLAVAWRQLR